MRQGWRWYGPDAGVPLDTIRQAGATDVVSALHQVPIGAAWTREAVSERKALIETTPPGRTQLRWSVVESIPIPDAVKRTGAAAKAEIEAWIASMEAVAANGIGIVCYNFMPVVDWTRTDLDFVTPTGSTAMRFDQDKFAAFDLFVLERSGAQAEYSAEARARARATFEAMDEAEVAYVTNNITSALPGSTTEPLTIPQFRDKLAAYASIDARQMRAHLVGFLEAVTPAAEACGVKLTLHPDDPPRSLFGLPRIASTAEDYAALFDAVPSPANGMCFCTGSLGVRAGNDLPAIARQFAARIHFAHLRATKREENPLSFHESAHLEGDVDMVAVIHELLAEDAKRSPETSIIFRPDHGQRMLGDLHEAGSPGYPAVGRLRGLAELRGIIAALTADR
ncbi:D-mannonate dehydratase [Hoeflea marina]|uniref:Mannonate dehydratase n=1 Tax=Hoeflea marina TaxID=274592 RepID=A0A317PL76_9HYPH|nr:mannonate dehydratase [Hoeflea marina]PWW01695.1 D-mannonate dehydratase [Hoeflea marina]